MSNNDEAVGRSWFPAVTVICVVFGLAYLAAGIVGGHPMVGLASLGIMLLFAVGTIIAGRRSETVRGLIDRRDERLRGIDLRATAATGQVLIVAVIIGALVELARGHSGLPYIWLGALAGVTYVVSVVIDRLRH